MKFHDRKNEILNSLPAEYRDCHAEYEINNIENSVYNKMYVKYGARFHVLDTGSVPGNASAEDLERITEMLRAEGHEEAYVKFDTDEDGDRHLVATNIFGLLDGEYLAAFEMEFNSWLHQTLAAAHARDEEQGPLKRIIYRRDDYAYVRKNDIEELSTKTGKDAGSIWSAIEQILFEYGYAGTDKCGRDIFLKSDD